MQPAAWEKHALCAVMVKQGRADPDDWFPRSRSGSAKAIRVCRSCQVATHCLLYALSSGVYGVWGGKYIGSSRLKSGKRNIEGELEEHAASNMPRDEKGRYVQRKRLGWADET